MKGLAIRVLASQLANLALTILFVVFLHKGANGAAIATLLALIMVEVFIVWPFCRELAHTSVQQWLGEVIYPTLVPSIIPLIICVFVKYNFGITSWNELIIVSAISAIIYILLVIVFALREQDRLDLERLANKHTGIKRDIILKIAQGFS